MQGRMIRKITFSGLLCCVLFFSTHALAGFPRDIQKQLNLPEQQLDIGIAALTFAKAIYPDLDIAAYSSRIDLLADRVRQLAGGSQDPEQRIRAL
ncbi:MAG: hypothetical protein ACRES4_09190, partial [Nevskiales bacterium]